MPPCPFSSPRPTEKRSAPKAKHMDARFAWKATKRRSAFSSTFDIFARARAGWVEDRERRVETPLSKTRRETAVSGANETSQEVKSNPMMNSLNAACVWVFRRVSGIFLLETLLEKSSKKRVQIRRPAARSDFSSAGLSTKPVQCKSPSI